MDRLIRIEYEVYKKPKSVRLTVSDGRAFEMTKDDLGTLNYALLNENHWRLDDAVGFIECASIEAFDGKIAVDDATEEAIVKWVPINSALTPALKGCC